ncbi:DUF4123 domain-containing protein [Glaesserella sp.]|uniref:DUF4123 domain-containing protein n=1 Tax=Glaesserella sp. TaxID=2094731 RepID=UPI00359F1FCC
MQNENRIYAVDVQLFSGNESEAAVVLIYAPNAELAKNKITIYQQQHQLRLNYALLPLPLELYVQRHADGALIEPIRTASRDLSDARALIIFMPNRYQQSDKTDSPCLIKTEVLLRNPNEARGPFLFQALPDSVIPYLWPEDDSDNCYVIVNAESSAWFPTGFERDDIRFACLYKGEQAERKRNIAPYLIKLSASHSFAEALFSTPMAGKENDDGPQQWYKHFGFFFRSRAEFDELLQHFRKFMILPTYDERQLYFRFYDPRVLEDYLDRLLCYPKKLAAFWGGRLIESIMLPKGDYFVHYAPNTDLSAVTPAKKQFDKFEVEEFIKQYNQTLYIGLVDSLLNTSPFLLKQYTRKEIEDVVYYHHNISKQYHFHESVTIGIFTLITLLYGKTIDKLDPEPVILSLLKSDYLTELDKAYYIKQRIEFLESQSIIYNKFKEHYDKQFKR